MADLTSNVDCPYSLLFMTNAFSGDPYRTFLCARVETAEDGIFDTIFSVPPPKVEFATTVKQRAVVEYHGDDSGKGTWKCSKDASAISCPHIVQARHSLQQHIQCNIEAYDEEAGTGELEYQGTKYLFEEYSKTNLYMLFPKNRYQFANQMLQASLSPFSQFLPLNGRE